MQEKYIGGPGVLMYLSKFQYLKLWEYRRCVMLNIKFLLTVSFAAALGSRRLPIAVNVTG
jgi:hypothetical protein